MTLPTAHTPSLQATRLAPSPTGALHLGNARTFLVNWALARQRGWKIYLRIEDLDTPRVKPGALEDLVETLSWLGIDWDRWDQLSHGADRLVQSSDLSPYRAAMRTLASRGLAYPCELTRSQIELAASAPQEGAHEVPFPAALRPPDVGRLFDFDAIDSASRDRPPPNWRMLVEPGEVTFTDEIAGPQRHDVSRIVGDFVLWTRRGQPSYQLAVVVDDHRQGVTQVVRGDDLLDSAARQLLIYRALGLAPQPTYTHLPLVRGPDGKRLAKRHGDTRVDMYRQRGVPADAVVGLIAAWCGIGARSAPRRMSAPEFNDRLSLATIPPGSITFTPEDDAWLLSNALR